MILAPRYIPRKEEKDNKDALEINRRKGRNWILVGLGLFLFDIIVFL